MKNILIIGGTRNMGHDLTMSLLEKDYHVTILNRGMSKDGLPEHVHRLRADRTEPQQMKRALMGKSFDVVIDFVMYKKHEAEIVIDLLKGQIDHYIFISSGQVYLVREDIERPFKESDYEGRLLPAPKANTFAYEEWLYGIDKRMAEDTFAEAHAKDDFPYTALRLPMVNSRRDHFRRLYSYYLRLKDGGTILVPETPTFPLRHIFGDDVVRALELLIESGKGKGQAFNISQEETVSIDEFLTILGSFLDVEPEVVRVKRSLLEANGFLPDCSPFSERWMSELDNSLSKEALGMSYTPLETYLGLLVKHYSETKIAKPVSYKRRPAELNLAESILSGSLP